MAIENWIAVSKADFPQTSMVKWDGTNLTQEDTLGIGQHCDDCSWHPDGELIAFVRIASPTLYLLRWDGADLTLVDTLNIVGSRAYGVCFSPDGQWIAVAHDTSPYFTMVKWDGANLSIVATYTLDGIGYDCWWSPDGQFIAVANISTTFKILRWDGANLFLADSIDLGSTRYGSCQFTSDGRYIAIASPAASGVAPHLKVVSWDGVSMALVATYTTDGWGYGQCRWNVQNNLIALVRTHSPYVVLVKFDGTSLTLGDTYDTPASSVGCSFDPGGTLIFVAHVSLPYLSLLEWDGNSLSLKATCNVGSNGWACEFYKTWIPQPPLQSVTKGTYRLKVGKYMLTCDASKQNVIDAHFTLRQNGGCAEFNFQLGRPDFDISLGDEVLIYLYGQVAPWYRGRILERNRDGASTRIRNYSGYGHFEFLNGGDLVDVRYGAGEAIDDLRDAVIDVLDTCVRPYGTLITASNAKIEDPSYTISELEFDKVKPIDALTDLCELAEGWEFGIDEVGDFYFRQESAATLQDKWVGKHVATFIPSENMRNLINRWYLEGGKLAGGTNYDSLVEDVISQGLYGTRSDKATMPSGMNTGEIGKWGDDLLAKSKDPVMKAVISGIDIERTQTRIWPRGRMRLTSEDGLHSYRFPIRVLTYHITPAGVTADVELGPKTTHIRDYLADLDKKIKKEREQLAIDIYQLAMGTGLVDDCIKDNHIDWGTGANQVSAVDVPIADAGGYFVSTEVEGALQEAGAAMDPTLRILIFLGL